MASSDSLCRRQPPPPANGGWPRRLPVSDPLHQAREAHPQPAPGHVGPDAARNRRPDPVPRLPQLLLLLSARAAARSPEAAGADPEFESRRSFFFRFR